MARNEAVPSTAQQSIQMLLNIIWPWDEPQSRLYWSHLLVTLLLIVVWAFSRPSVRQAWRRRNYRRIYKYFRYLLFAPQYWWHPSARTDYFLFLFNGCLKAFFFSWTLGFSFFIAKQIWTVLEVVSPTPQLSPQTIWIAAFTFFAFIFDDFLRFFHHYLSHKIPWLWYLHKVHHSAEVLTPITLYRAHPLESLMNSFRNGLSHGVISGIFVYLFQAPLNLWTVMGVNILGFTFNLLGANLRHSHIPLHFGPFWGRIFISPLAHQIHHSSKKKHYNKNFGVTLAIWDQLFNSWYPPDPKEPWRLGINSQNII